MKRTTGQTVSAALEALGVRCLFGMPGTQNVELFEELRTSPLRVVLATSELAAAFMAMGHARLSGLPGVLVTIPGPGFTYALSGLAEARLDSVPLLHIVVHGPLPPGRRFRHQEIEHLDIVRPLVKEVVEVNEAGEVPLALVRAWNSALAGEPGPVLLWISTKAFGGPVLTGGRISPVPGSDDVPSAPGTIADTSDPGPVPLLSDSSNLADPLAVRLSAARRPVLFLGLGALGSADQVLGLAEKLNSPVFTTASARGVVPEDHPLCLAFDFVGGGLEVLNALLGTADLVLALGCKLGYSGTGGFRLKMPEDSLIHVNTDSEALGANYPASLQIQAKVEDVVGQILASPAFGPPESEWTSEEVGSWRSRIQESGPSGPPEPTAPGAPSGRLRELIEILQDELQRDAIVLTDSGLHQMMIRRHLKILAPQGLVMPTDFQSMGFGLPAAIGAKLAVPGREVVAVIGDGGLAMSGMELLTLARERIPLTVLVFNDGYLNLIRLQQEGDYGHGHAVRLLNPNIELLAEACGVGFARLDSDVRERIRSSLQSDVPTLVEVPLGESRSMLSARLARRTKTLVGRAVGDRLLATIKRLLRKATKPHSGGPSKPLKAE